MSSQATVRRAQQVVPVKAWAALGAAMLAVELFFIGKWVTGDAFTPVDSGPDTPPDFMVVAVIFGQVFFVSVALFMLYRLLYLPIRREGRVSTDGFLCIAALLASPWDMFSNYWDYWFTYNSYHVNMGSVMSALPGVSPHEPGQGEAWPILMIPGAYITIFVGLAILGCRFLAWYKRRRPNAGAIQLVAVLYVATMLFYLVIDGLICMPLGLWQFGGGHIPLLNGDTYYKYPLQEMITAGAVFTIFTCWRYFRNDRGETIAERGIDKVNAGTGTKTLLRGLALLAVVHLGMFATYHVPNGLMAKSATEWPQDVQKRSYFTNNLCAEGTGVPCPGSPGATDGLTKSVPSRVGD